MGFFLLCAICPLIVPPSLGILFMYFAVSSVHLLKSNFPSISVCDEIVGLRWQGFGIFKVIGACGISQHNGCIGKQVYVLDTPAMK